jgi:hypothetical protein
MYCIPFHELPGPPRDQFGFVDLYSSRQLFSSKESTVVFHQRHRTTVTTAHGQNTISLMHFCPRPTSLRVDVSLNPQYYHGVFGGRQSFLVFSPLLSVGPCMRESILQSAPKTGTGDSLPFSSAFGPVALNPARW